MRKIVILPLAVQDLEDVVEYLSQFYESTALRQYDRIIEKVNTLLDFPEMCEIYEPEKYRLTYRKLVVDDYLVFYALTGQEIQIYRILHGSRDIKRYL